MRIDALLLLALMTLLLSACGAKLSDNEKLLVGQWEIIDINADSFLHPSFCNVKVGGIFHFENDKSLKVYPNELDGICSKDHFYSCNGKKLMIREWDMFFDYQIISFNKDSLILRSTIMPFRILYDDSNKKETRELNKNDVIISMKKNGS